MGSIGIIAELEDSIELIHEKFANRDDMTADQEQKTYDSIGENIMKIIKSVKSNEREFKAVKGKMEKKAFIVAKQKIDQIRIKIQEIVKIGQKTRNEISEKREQEEEGSEDKEGKGKDFIKGDDKDGIFKKFEKKDEEKDMTGKGKEFNKEDDKGGKFEKKDGENKATKKKFLK